MTMTMIIIINNDHHYHHCKQRWSLAFDCDWSSQVCKSVLDNNFLVNRSIMLMVMVGMMVMRMMMIIIILMKQACHQFSDGKMVICDAIMMTMIQEFLNESLSDEENESDNDHTGASGENLKSSSPNFAFAVIEAFLLLQCIAC